MDGTILIADDDRSIRTVLSAALTRAGCKVHATASLTMLRKWVEEGMGDVVITDVMMPDGNGLQELPHLRALRPDLPIIVISAQNSLMTALQAEEAEAWDYLPKPFDLPDLLRRTARAMGHQPEQPSAVPTPDLPLLGQSAPMQALYRRIAKVVNAPLPVLISGESGSGKSLLARVLHDLSARRDRRCITATEEDLASTASAQALAARAGPGSLVFDDVEDLPDDAQARLIRLIDSTPEARIIACAGTPEALRPDLFFRLAGTTLALPPLRGRSEDIVLHAESVIPQHQLSEEALQQLRAYPWPGNVRQLNNVLHALALHASGREITMAQVDEVLAGQPRPSTQSKGLSDAVAQHIGAYFDSHGDVLPAPGLYARVLHEVEAPLISRALDACGGNQARCAELLGINRNTLRKKILDLGIEVTRRRKMM